MIHDPNPQCPRPETTRRLHKPAPRARPAPVLNGGLLLGILISSALAADCRAAEFLVGVPLSLSGGLARVGSEMERGIATAAADFNQSQSRHRIRLLVQDDESAPAKAVAAVEQLASQGVVAIVGGYSSNIVAPASDSANRLGLVYLTSGALSQGLSRRGLSNFFRINDNNGYARAVSRFLAEVGVASVSILYSNRDASQELAQLLLRHNQARGIRRNLMHGFEPGVQDFKPLLNKVRLRDKPDIIVMIAYENDYIGMLRAARVLKPEVKAMLGVWGLATSKMAADFPELVNNVLGAALLSYPPSFKTEAGRRFYASYHARYRNAPDYMSEMAYVQGQVLFEAIARAADKGSLKRPGGLAAELRNTRRDTLIGPLSFDANGDNPHFTQYIGQHQDGGRVVLVSPAAQATGKLNYPAVPWQIKGKDQ
ncbi:ABC transporter substrate-binding protein [Chromobacterium aquaticum]|uniref:ABC transporter substrate-binding protein n=1 Tax=Chromobacterium aquaticum TaxID=467180 RepID=A0ABV8ZQM9_9NEIS